MENRNINFHAIDPNEVIATAQCSCYNKDMYRILFFFCLLCVGSASGPLQGSTARADEPIYIEAENEYLSLEARQADIRVLFTLISRSSGINLVMDKEVQGQITLSLEDVHYVIALHLIARTNGYRVVRIDNIYYIGSPENQAGILSGTATRTFRLNFAEAQTVAGILGDLYGDRILVAVDHANNAIIVSGELVTLEEISRSLLP